jgi:hypothetical protein
MNMNSATGYKRFIVATLARIAVVFVALVVTAAACRSELAAFESPISGEEITMQTARHLTPTVRSHSKQRVIGRRVNLKARTKKLDSGVVVIMLQKSDNILYGPAFNESSKTQND